MFSGQGGECETSGSPPNRMTDPHAQSGDFGLARTEGQETLPQTGFRTTPIPRSGPPGFLAWFPWEKILIWALFLSAVYVLRHFFFIIFMTFMITYIMANVVK